MKQVKRAKRYRQKLSLSMLDIDHFKKVNDQYGHIVGDDVLERVATLMRQHIREVDIAGHYGGEEFIIILPNTDLSSALSMAERIRKSIEEAEMKDYQGNVFGISISEGVSDYSPPKMNSPLSPALTLLSTARRRKGVTGGRLRPDTGLQWSSPSHSIEWTHHLSTKRDLRDRPHASTSPPLVQ